MTPATVNAARRMRVCATLAGNAFLNRPASPMTAHTFEFEFVSRLAAPAQTVWAHATSMAGVNRELWPLVRMTHPRGMLSLNDDRLVLGERVFRSWILFLGILPIDFDDLTLIEIEPGRRFLERSPMLSQRLWEHERRVVPVEGGCSVTDHVQFTPRVVGLGRLQLPIFRFAFRLRHRTLCRLFGSLDAGGFG